MPPRIADTIPLTTPVAPGLKRKHIELVVFHSRHAATIERFWRSLDQTERLAAIASENLDEPIMAHANDSSKRYRNELLRVLAGDWNVRDMVDTNFDHLLQMLARRVTGTLLNQVDMIQGSESGSDPLMRCKDIPFIIVCIAGQRQHEPRFKDEVKEDKRYMLLEDKAWYGDGRIVTPEMEPGLVGRPPSEQLVLNWSIARLVLLRQEYIVTRLTSLMQHLVKLEAWIRTNKVHSSIWAREGQRARPMQAFEETEGTKRTVGALIETSGKFTRATKAQLHSTMGDPYSLRCASMASRNTQNQYHAMDLGSQQGEDLRIPNAAFHALGLMSNELQYWKYMNAMLRLYQRASDNQKARDAIRHEILLVAVRFVGTAVVNLFDQLAGGLALNYCTYVDSKPRMLDPPGFQNPMDDLLLFLVGLTIPQKPLDELVASLEMLDVMFEQEPTLLGALGYAENIALCNLARFAGFYSALIETLPGPSSDPGKSCLWTDYFTDPTEEMCAAMDDAWDDFIEVTSAVCQSYIYEVDHGGWNEGWVREKQRLYEEATIAPVVKKCLGHFEALAASYEASPRSHAKSCSAESEASHETPAKTSDASPTSATTKVKVKTRPAQPGNAAADVHGHENKTHAAQSLDSEQPAAAATTPRYTVRPQTAATLTAIFSKGQGRADVNWTAFTAAMTDLGFAVIPTKGALVTFAPPTETMPGTRGFGLHRPHKGVLEGFRLMNTARRLTKRYGWTVETFESAKGAAL